MAVSSSAFCHRLAVVLQLLQLQLGRTGASLGITPGVIFFLSEGRDNDSFPTGGRKGALYCTSPVGGLVLFSMHAVGGKGEI